jgi:hypothetical protein
MYHSFLLKQTWKAFGILMFEWDEMGMNEIEWMILLQMIFTIQEWDWTILQYAHLKAELLQRRAF